MDVNSIASLSMYMAQSNVMQNISTAVLDMAMDGGQTQGQNAAALLEASVQPDIGSNIDVSV